MESMGGIIKNQGFKEAESSRITMSSLEEFAYSVQNLLHQLPEDITTAPAIIEILHIHRLQRSFNRQRVPYIEYFKLSNK